MVIFWDMGGCYERLAGKKTELCIWLALALGWVSLVMLAW